MRAPPVRFETLIELYHDEIMRYLWRLLNSAGRSDSDLEAQDLTQEAFARAYGAFGRLRHDSNHRAWLYKIATNLAYTALKQDQRRDRNSIPLEEEAHGVSTGAGQSPHDQAVLSETLEAVRRAIATLPPKQATAVVLRHVQGLGYSEIAEALDCSQDSARANVYQGLRRLRQDLGAE